MRENTIRWRAENNSTNILIVVKKNSVGMKTKASWKCVQKSLRVIRNKEVMAIGWPLTLEEYYFKFCHYKS